MSGGRLGGSGPSTHLLRDGGWLAGTQTLNLVGKLVGIRLLTSLLSPEAFGEVALLMGVLSLSNDAICIPVLTATLRFYPEAASAGRVQELRRLVARMLRIGLLASGAALSLGGALWITFSHVAASFWSLPLLVWIMVFDVRRTFEMNMLNAARRQAPFGLWGVADAWARPLLAAACILLWAPNALAVLFGYGLGTLGVNLVMRPAVVRTSPDEAAGDARAWRLATTGAILRFAAPLVPLALLGWISTLGDRFVIAELATAGDVGIYAAAYGLASQPFILVAGTVALTLRPVVFDAHVAEDLRKRRRTLIAWLVALVATLVPGVILMDWLSELLVGLMLGEAFRDAAPLLVWLGAAYAIQGFQQAFAALIYAEGRTQLLVVIHAVAAATALVLYFVLIPRYGAMGAAYAAVGSRSVACCFTFVLARAHKHLLWR